MSKEVKIIIGIAVVVLVGGFFLLSQDSSTNVANQIVSHPDSYVLGNDSAPVTIVEFADFQCPACAAAAPLVKQISEQYKDQVKIVFRHFPLPMHKNAMSAAYAAEAAGEQGKFWDMYELIYANQPEWENQVNPKDSFVKYAQSLQLNLDQFTQALDSKKFDEKIQRDVAEGQGLGVNSTPTFFINGEKYVGVPKEDFKNKIDAILNQ